MWNGRAVSCTAEIRQALPELPLDKHCATDIRPKPQCSAPYRQNSPLLLPGCFQMFKCRLRNSARQQFGSEAISRQTNITTHGFCGLPATGLIGAAGGIVDAACSREKFANERSAPDQIPRNVLKFSLVIPPMVLRSYAKRSLLFGSAPTWM